MPKVYQKVSYNVKIVSQYQKLHHDVKKYVVM